MDRNETRTDHRGRDGPLGGGTGAAFLLPDPKHTAPVPTANQAAVDALKLPDRHRRHRSLVTISEISWALRVYFGDAKPSDHTWYHLFLKGELKRRGGVSQKALDILNAAGKAVSTEVLSRAGRPPSTWGAQPADTRLTLEHLERQQNLPTGDVRRVSPLALGFLESNLNSKWQASKMTPEEKEFFEPSIPDMDLLLDTMRCVAETYKPTSLSHFHAYVFEQEPKLKKHLVAVEILGAQSQERRDLQRLFREANGEVKQQHITSWVAARTARISAPVTTSSKQPKRSWIAEIESILGSGVTFPKGAERFIADPSCQSKLVADVRRLTEQQKEALVSILTRRNNHDRVGTLVGGPAAGKTNLMVISIVLQICMHKFSTDRPAYIITQMRPTADEIVGRLDSYGLDTGGEKHNYCSVYRRKTVVDKATKAAQGTLFIARYKVYTFPMFAWHVLAPLWLYPTVPLEKRHSMVDNNAAIGDDTPEALAQRRELSDLRRRRECGDTKGDDGKDLPDLAGDLELQRAIDAINSAGVLKKGVDPEDVFNSIFPRWVRFEPCFAPHDDSIADELGRGKVLFKFWAQCRRSDEWVYDTAPDKKILSELYEMVKERCVAKNPMLFKVVQDRGKFDAYLSNPDKYDEIRQFSKWFLDGAVLTASRKMPSAQKLACFMLRLREKALRIVSNGECSDPNRFPFRPNYAEYVTTETIEQATEDSEIHGLKPSEIVAALQMYDNILLAAKQIEWPMLYFVAYTTMKKIEGSIAVWVDEAQTAPTLFLNGLLRIFAEQDEKTDRLLMLAGQPQQNTMAFAGGHGDFRGLVSDCEISPSVTMQLDLTVNFASSKAIVALYNRTIVHCEGGDPLFMEAREGAPDGRPVVFLMCHFDTTKVPFSQEDLAELGDPDLPSYREEYRLALARQPYLTPIASQRYELIAQCILEMLQKADESGHPLETTSDDDGNLSIHIGIYSRVNDFDLKQEVERRLGSMNLPSGTPPIVLYNSTCHQSLGMRAPHVIVTGFEPKYYDDYDDDALDARIAIQNLTMVSNSRPKYTLYFIVHVFPKFDRVGDRIPLRPGVFLNHLFPRHDPLVRREGVEEYKY